MFAENKLAPAAGRLLVAEPFLNDGYFKRAVVLLTEYNEKGSIGFILNKPLEIRMTDAVLDFPDFDIPAMLGGPVQRDQLYYIHTLGERIPDSQPVGKNLWWLGDFGTVKDLIARKEVGEQEIRFFIGYSGWEKGQLEKEMQEKSWYVSKTDIDLVFSAPETMWKEALRKMGKDFELMVNYPEDPSMN